jgi:hypothetical protein
MNHSSSECGLGFASIGIAGKIGSINYEVTGGPGSRVDWASRIVTVGLER